MIYLSTERRNRILFLCQNKANRRREIREAMWRDIIETIAGIALLTLLALVLAYWPA